MLYEIVLEYSECKNQEGVHIDVITPPPTPPPQPPHPKPPRNNSTEYSERKNQEGVHIDVITHTAPPPPPQPPHPKPQREIQPLEKYARLHARFYTRWHIHTTIRLLEKIMKPKQISDSST